MLFLKVFSLLNFREKLQVNLLLISFFIAFFFEIISVGLMIPIFSKVFFNSQAISFFGFNIEIYLDFFKINIILLSILVFFIFFIKNIILFFLRIFQSKVIFNIRYRISSNLYQTYLFSDYNFHLNHNSAILIRNINASRSVGIHILYLTEIISDIILIILLAVTSLFIFPKTVIIYFLIYSSFLALYYFYFKKKLTMWSKLDIENEFFYTRHLQESFNSIKEIIVSNKSKIFTDNFNKLNFRLKTFGYNLNWLPQASKYFTETFVVLFLIILLHILFQQNTSADMNLQILLMLTFIFYRLFPAMQKVLSSFQRINVMSGPMRIVVNEFEKINSFKSNNKERNYIPFNSKISFKNISFSYEGHSKILDNVNFDILKNDFVAITGSSGSGKTTLVDLLCGLLKASSGSILIDEKTPISTTKSLKVGYVSQFVSLLDDTILKNIAFADKESRIDLGKIDRILDLVNLKEFVCSLPNNIYSVIGEHGNKISGGQRQRIGIARALYNNIELLILDEPTSMLDEINEKYFFENLRNLKNSITVVLISHNKKNLSYFDCIYELKNGNLNRS